MKTTAFLIRVAICLLLSLIPVTELDQRIYSGRMELRGILGKSSEVLLVQASHSDVKDAGGIAAVEALILSLQPKLLIISWSPRGNGLYADHDGVVRRASFSSQGATSLGFLAKQALHQGLRVLDLSEKITDENHPEADLSELSSSGHFEPQSHLINYSGPAGSMARTELNQLHDPLHGKIVLLTRDLELGRTLHTPIGDMSLIEAVANDIQTVALHQPIYSFSYLGTLIIILMMIFIGAFFIIYFPVMTSAFAIISTGIVIVVFLFQLLFHFFSIYIPSGNLILAMLITYLIFTGYRLALQENLQWRSLKQAQYLRELDRMKTNFLSLVSHDLKTPLAKIQAVMERLRRELLLPVEQRSDWKELIDSIENSNNEMKHYITSILNLSKIESQKVILNKKSNDLNQLIQQALKRLRPLAIQKNIKVEEYLEPLFSIECDEDLMRQVLTNLVDNAIKYSPSNSRIIVRSKEEDGFVRIEVEDFGPGIPKDQLPLMFRKFGRFLQPIKEQVKGSGLGLYLSKYFIELHGGSIRMKTVEGEGTTFSFTLPVNNMENETILC